ncbi:unnamed protein product [Ceratitis capitata]|uniref:(Mediterranean fruit fly) hypothetical protein n=1 Tax=Ceratitis capitata TaxID=7213 RepID=A0A811V278_CERCA|nr:unnamed protein product [Ceratitis capitata]
MTHSQIPKTDLTSPYFAASLSCCGARVSSKKHGTNFYGREEQLLVPTSFTAHSYTQPGCSSNNNNNANILCALCPFTLRVAPFAYIHIYMHARSHYDNVVAQSI